MMIEADDVTKSYDNLFKGNSAVAVEEEKATDMVAYSRRRTALPIVHRAVRACDHLRPPSSLRGYRKEYDGKRIVEIIKIF